jgi:Ca2+-binding RTX toxin-like protein
LSHDPKAIELGWVVEEHSPFVSGLTVTPGATSGQSRIAANVEFTDQDPVVLHIEGANATAPLFGWLDFTITNNSGVSWTEFNISAIDTFVEPPTTSFPPMAAHPFHSHFHDVNLTQNLATNPVFSGPSQFSRLGYTTILDRNEAVAPNSWEFTGGTFGSGTTEQWTNFRIHQWQLDDRMINMATVVSGGSFHVILTPNESHIDYNGYVVTEDEQNTNSLSGDAPIIPSGTLIPRLDLMFGYEGNDRINAGALNDIVYGGAGDDTIGGGTGDDHLRGGAGDDTFKGGSGNDTIDGGAGNIDTLVLPGVHEDYAFQLLSITSNEWLITGPDGGDLTTAVEFFQFDTLRFSAADIILGNPGTPITPPGEQPPPEQPPPGEAEVRNGGNGDDTLIADLNRAADFRGGGGNDKLTGSDLADELRGEEGNDTVNGLAGDDYLDGGPGKDRVLGGLGHDTVNGGYGNDVLYGQTGGDAFMFDAKLGTARTDRKVNFDKVADFNVKADSFWLDNAVFKKLGGKGSEDHPAKLKKAFFTIGDHAQDKNDYLIYDSKTGVLSYDADGSGAKAAVEFAKLKKDLKLSYHDFFVI